MELQFKQLMPEVANQIQGVKEIMFNEFGGLTHNQERLEQVVDHVDNQISEVVSRLTPIEAFTGRFARGEVKWITHLINSEGSSGCANDSSSRLASGRDRSPLISSDSIAAAPPSSNSDAVALPSSAADDVLQRIPQYEINNNLRTVGEMWEEWDQGLVDDNSGIRSPSIRYLEEKYSTTWRVAERSRKRFSRRRLFIQRLQMASKNLYLPEVLVAQKVENWRRSRKMSLDKLQKTLQANPNQWSDGDVELLDW